MGLLSTGRPLQPALGLFRLLQLAAEIPALLLLPLGGEGGRSTEVSGGERKEGVEKPTSLLHPSTGTGCGHQKRRAGQGWPHGMPLPTGSGQESWACPQQSQGSRGCEDPGRGSPRLLGERIRALAPPAGGQRPGRRPEPVRQAPGGLLPSRQEKEEGGTRGGVSPASSAHWLPEGQARHHPPLLCTGEGQPAVQRLPSDCTPAQGCPAPLA